MELVAWSWQHCWSLVAELILLFCSLDYVFAIRLRQIIKDMRRILKGAEMSWWLWGIMGRLDFVALDKVGHMSTLESYMVLAIASSSPGQTLDTEIVRLASR
jgi:hypothetical protein